MTAEPQQPENSPLPPDHESSEQAIKAGDIANQLFFELLHQEKKSIADCGKEALEHTLKEFPALNQAEKEELAQVMNALVRIVTIIKHTRKIIIGHDGKMIPDPTEREGGGRGM